MCQTGVNGVPGIPPGLCSSLTHFQPFHSQNGISWRSGVLCLFPGAQEDLVGPPQLLHSPHCDIPKLSPQAGMGSHALEGSRKTRGSLGWPGSLYIVIIPDKTLGNPVGMMGIPSQNSPKM